MDYEKLKSNNQQELSKLDKPYQLAVYALPQEQWEALLTLLQSNLPLLPEVLQAQKQAASQNSLRQHSQKMQTALNDLSRQGGRNYAEICRRFQELEQSVREDMEEERKKLQAWMMRGFLFLTALLALLVILAI